MKICVLHDNYYRSSGSAVIIRRIYEAFQGTGVEFSFVGCSAPTAGGASAEEDLGWMPEGRYAHFNLMGNTSALPGEVARFVRWTRQSQCELIHAHHRRLAAFAHLTSHLHGRPVVFTAHNTFAPSVLFWLAAPPVVTGVSPSVVNYLERCTRVKEPHLTWNPLRFSQKPPRPKDLHVAANRAMSVGRLEPVKGHANIILAWKRIASLGIHPQLNIFGEGHLREELDAMIRREGMQGQIRLRGFAADLEEEFDSSLFNILGSFTEGFPNVVVEAAARNTGSLVTDVDGSRDTVPPRVVLPNKVKPGDIDSLANHLVAWFSDPRAVVSDGVAFREFLKDKCSMEAVRDTYAEIYRQRLARTSIFRQPLSSISRLGRVG